MTALIRLRVHQVAFVLLALLCSAIPVHAQSAFWRAEHPSFVRMTRGPLTLEGSAGFGDTDPQFSSGSAIHRIPFRASGATGRLELGGLIGQSLPGTGEYGRIEGRLLFDVRRSGVWFGAAGRSDDDHPGGQLTSLLGAGAWIRSRSWISSVGLEQTADVLTRREYIFTYAESAFVPLDHREPIRRTSLHAGIGWSRGRVALESMFGVSVSPIAGPQQWVRGSAAVTVVPGLALVAAGGSKGPDLFGYAEHHTGQATLGFRVTPSWGDSRSTSHEDGSLEWAVLREGDGMYTIEVRGAGNARTVEITSDATGWEPRALTRGSDGRWRLRLHLDDGVYHVNLRLDGGPWIVPPGALKATDEFIGDTGMIVIGG